MINFRKNTQYPVLFHLVMFVLKNLILFLIIKNHTLDQFVAEYLPKIMQVYAFHIGIFVGFVHSILAKRDRLYESTRVTYLIFVLYASITLGQLILLHQYTNKVINWIILVIYAGMLLLEFLHSARIHRWIVPVALRQVNGISVSGEIIEAFMTRETLKGTRISLFLFLNFPMIKCLLTRKFEMSNERDLIAIIGQSITFILIVSILTLITIDLDEEYEQQRAILKNTIKIAVFTSLINFISSMHIRYDHFLAELCEMETFYLILFAFLIYTHGLAQKESKKLRSGLKEELDKTGRTRKAL